MDSVDSLIRRLREQLGMSQEDFAHEVAVTVSTVNRWENARAEPSKLARNAIGTLARKHRIMIPIGLGSPQRRRRLGAKSRR